MAYTEVIKNFDRIRDYMREFYVYGFKSRDEFTKKSGRSYDDERRRLESWLGDYMQFRRVSEGANSSLIDETGDARSLSDPSDAAATSSSRPGAKTVFLSIDSRISHHNPLYKAWKAKSFTDGDITLHFILMDILACSDEPMALADIARAVDEYLGAFDDPATFDESTIRKKLKEYEAEGIVIKEKQGRSVRYRRSEMSPAVSADVLDFFSEVAPCGVIGSFLLDKKDSYEEVPCIQTDHESLSAEPTGSGAAQRNPAAQQPPQNKSEACKEIPGRQFGHKEVFAFKHHYINSALDSEILCRILDAMHDQRSVRITVATRRKDKTIEDCVIPVRVMISAQSGRQYMMAYTPHFDRITPFRIDNILSVEAGDVSPEFERARASFAEMEKHMWGVSTEGRAGAPARQAAQTSPVSSSSTEDRAVAKLEHVEFTVRYRDDELHIRDRLEREKRCGRVERLDKNTSRFSADVYDAGEMIPWIRTFICRITDIHFSDNETEAQFKQDIEEMYKLYGV